MVHSMIDSVPVVPTQQGKKNNPRDDSFAAEGSHEAEDVSVPSSPETEEMG